jgi:RNA polymerase sigma factor (sigma-70 family)
VVEDDLHLPRLKKTPLVARLISKKMIRLTRQGADLAAIEAVYRARFSDFCSVAAAILRDRDAGRDAVQDAFAKAVRNRGDFRREGSLDAWLWRTVVNTALSERRRAGLDRASSVAHGPASMDGAAADDVRAAIQRLPERQRLVIFLRYWAALDYAAIADALAVAPGTVAASLHAAHGSIRNCLQEVGT